MNRYKVLSLTHMLIFNSVVSKNSDSDSLLKSAQLTCPINVMEIVQVLSANEEKKMNDNRVYFSFSRRRCTRNQPR